MPERTQREDRHSRRLRSPLVPALRRCSLPEREATPEAVYLDRRRFIHALGLGGIAVAAGAAGCRLQPAPPREELAAAPEGAPAPDLYPAERAPAHDVGVPPVKGPLTRERVASRYNNFYEFGNDKDEVWKRSDDLQVDPWSLQVDGLVERPQTFAIEDLVRAMPLEERVYRFRCVEAWAMVVPWTGFPLRALLDRVRPLSGARYVRFTTFDPPRGSRGRLFHPFAPWPYTEGLTLAEARNELTLVATGIYGHPLPTQHGAPLRMVIPWKYGFKGAKSIVRITLTGGQPDTFWNTLAPDEYGFESNVNPEVPHPRWSQATERLIDTGERRPTLLYNGYGEWVADLYRSA